MFGWHPGASPRLVLADATPGFFASVTGLDERMGVGRHRPSAAVSERLYLPNFGRHRPRGTAAVCGTHHHDVFHCRRRAARRTEACGDLDRQLGGDDLRGCISAVQSMDLRQDRCRTLRHGAELRRSGLAHRRSCRSAPQCSPQLAACRVPDSAAAVHPLCVSRSAVSGGS